MPREKYNNLQFQTAENIAGSVINAKTENVILDTHGALDTPSGYRPGLAASDLDQMNPAKIVQIHSSPQEIQSRRESDDSRDRTVPSVESIKEQQEIATQMVSAGSVISRAPFSRIENPDGKIGEASQELHGIINA